MAASKKAIDNSNRLRYIRALERFHKSIISYFLNTPQLTKEGFVKKIDNGLKLLNRVDEIDLYKGELKDLQTLVKKIISLKESENSIEDIKDDIIYSSNQLDKSKNARRYKKDKHQNSKYKDWE
jgi:dGTP triphosphohydrolase